MILQFLSWPGQGQADLMNWTLPMFGGIQKRKGKLWEGCHVLISKEALNKRNVFFSFFSRKKSSVSFFRKKYFILKDILFFAVVCVLINGGKFKLILPLFVAQAAAEIQQIQAIPIVSRKE
jgi:hypothetical protein